jgi:preprotein translocase subunit SecG
VGLYLNIGQILVSVIIVLIILLQVKEGSAGLFGSPGGTVRTRRGLEKTLFQFTIVLSAIFLAISILSVHLVNSTSLDGGDLFLILGTAIGVLIVIIFTMRPGR